MWSSRTPSARPSDGSAAVCESETFPPTVRKGKKEESISADELLREAAVVEASRRALGRAGLTLNEVEVIELNEMSAAECLAVLRDWQTWRVAPEALAERVNPAGGALATGNPWGAMGAVLLARAVHALRRRSARIAMVALGAEGGQGMALVLRNAG